ncbi:MAG: hypothetical protein R3F11_20580 [Verrucomicrobiales bacterium]
MNAKPFVFLSALVISGSVLPQDSSNPLVDAELSPLFRRIEELSNSTSAKDREDAASMFLTTWPGFVADTTLTKSTLPILMRLSRDDNPDVQSASLDALGYLEVGIFELIESDPSSVNIVIDSLEIIVFHGRRGKSGSRRQDNRFAAAAMLLKFEKFRQPLHKYIPIERRMVKELITKENLAAFKGIGSISSLADEIVSDENYGLKAYIYSLRVRRGSEEMKADALDVIKREISREQIYSPKYVRFVSVMHSELSHLAMGNSPEEVWVIRDAYNDLAQVGLVPKAPVKNLGDLELQWMRSRQSDE